MKYTSTSTVHVWSTVFPEYTTRLIAMASICQALVQSDFLDWTIG